MKRWTESEIEFLKSSYPQLGSSLCAEKLKLSNSQVSNKAFSLNLKLDLSFKELRSETRRELAKKKFLEGKELIIDRDLSYLMGFCWGDGHFSKVGMKICCQKTDLSHIKLVLRRLNIKFYCADVKKYNENWKLTELIVIQDKLLNYFFEDNDYKDKSTVSCEKILSNIPKEFYADFLRGLCDADGCWYLSKDFNTRLFSLTSTYSQDWTSIENLLTNMNIKFAKTSRSKLNKKGVLNSDSSLRVWNQKGLETLASFLYSREGPFLQRKKDVVVSILNSYKNKNEELINLLNFQSGDQDLGSTYS